MENNTNGDLLTEEALEGSGIISAIVKNRLERYQLTNYDKILLN